MVFQPNMGACQFVFACFTVEKERETSGKWEGSWGHASNRAQVRCQVLSIDTWSGERNVRRVKFPAEVGDISSPFSPQLQDKIGPVCC